MIIIIRLKAAAACACGWCSVGGGEVEETGSTGGETGDLDGDLSSAVEVIMSPPLFSRFGPTIESIEKPRPFRLVPLDAFKMDCGGECGDEGAVEKGGEW